MIEVKVEQGSPEWHKLRAGKITGTRLDKVYKADNLSLVDELISEMVTGTTEEGVTTKAMQNGKDTEPVVRLIYQEVRGINIEEVGFCLAEWNDYLALSPDGFTFDRIGGIEIKCPIPKTHVKYIRQNQIPNEYKYQVFNYFLVNTKLEWIDFISYCETFTERPMWIKRVYRKDIENELTEARNELIKFTLKIEKYYKQIIN